MAIHELLTIPLARKPLTEVSTGELSPDALAERTLDYLLSHNDVGEIIGGCRADFGNPNRFSLDGSENPFEPFTAKIVDPNYQLAFGKAMTKFLPNLSRPENPFQISPEGTTDTSFIGTQEVTIVGPSMGHHWNGNWIQFPAPRALKVTIVNDGNTVTVPSLTMIPQYFGQ